jgi:hypothetical protein
MQFGLGQQQPASRPAPPAVKRQPQHIADRGFGLGMSRRGPRRRVELAVHNFADLYVWQKDQILIRRWPIKRWDSRHGLHCTSSSTAFRMPERADGEGAASRTDTGVCRGGPDVPFRPIANTAIIHELGRCSFCRNAAPECRGSSPGLHQRQVGDPRLASASPIPNP